MKPKIGDVWLRIYNTTHIEHLLIMQDDCDMGMMGLDKKGYSFIVLETGQEDKAWLEHFDRFCQFHS